MDTLLLSRRTRRALQAIRRRWCETHISSHERAYGRYLATILRAYSVVSKGRVGLNFLNLLRFLSL